MSSSSLDSVFDSFKNKKVLVLGDVMLDTYIYGAVNRISPEAPVPVVSVKSRENRLGGAANVALNVQALGAIPILCSVIGDDVAGESFCERLSSRGITDRGIIRSSNRVTTVKNRVLSGSQHLIRIDSEEDGLLTGIDKKSQLDHVSRLIDECDLIIFEDYDKGCIDADLIAMVIDKATEQGKLTAVDPKKRNFLSYTGCTLFKPNLKELKEGLGISVDPTNQGSIKSGVDQLHDQLKAANYLITLSQHGVYFQNDSTTGIHPAHLRSIADVSGAGDTVISIAALAIDAGKPLSFVAELANLGGGIVCEEPAIVPVDLEQLKEEAADDKILQD